MKMDSHFKNIFINKGDKMSSIYGKKIWNSVRREKVMQIKKEFDEMNVKRFLELCDEDKYLLWWKRLTGRSDTVCDKQDRKCAKGAPRKGGEIQYL